LHERSWSSFDRGGIGAGEIGRREENWIWNDEELVEGLWMGEGSGKRIMERVWNGG
jgi:hypothetical protein